MSVSPSSYRIYSAACEVAKRLPASSEHTLRKRFHRHLVRQAVRHQADQIAQVAVALDGLDGKCIVEVGSDVRAVLLRAIASTHRPRRLVGLNPDPAFSALELDPRIELRVAPAESSGLEADSVDGVFSFSAFEHIKNLPAVLDEMYRVLAPGGFLYAHFGPIWSAPSGHHLWVHHAGRLLNYHNVCLPPWAHLLLSEVQVAQYLRSEFSAEIAAEMAAYMFRSDEQNRLFFDDYQAVFDSSSFDVVYFKGYDDQELAKLNIDATSPSVCRRLTEEYPTRAGWLYDGISVLLRKTTLPWPGR